MTNGIIKELTITRILNAPRELIFKMWTDPKHLAQWWGPNGFSAPVCEADARPGGKIRIHMDHPAFPNHWMTGTFIEVVEPEKLVFTTKALENEEGVAPLENINTITFEDVNGKTRLTVHAAVTKATPEMAFALNGMDEGWKQSLDKLTNYLTEISHKNLNL
jgi:uncharacterized protein YndB with AHSA1/START domain